MSGEAPFTLSISPRRLVLGMAALVAFFFTAGVAVDVSHFFLHHGRLFGLTHLFALDEEGNFPTLYQALSLACVALILQWIGLAERARRSPQALRWQLLSGLWACMAVDEMMSFHEQLSDLFQDVDLAAPFYYGWVIIGLAVSAAAAVYFFPLVKALPVKTRWRMVLAVAVYLAAALGMEMAEGTYASRHGRETWTYAMMTNTEELFEMIGVILMTGTIADYAKSLSGGWLLRVTWVD